MFSKNQIPYFFVMILCIIHTTESSVIPSKSDHDFDEQCLYEGIEYVIANTQGRSPEDEYLMRRRYRAQAKSHPCFAQGLQTTGYLVIMDAQKTMLNMPDTDHQTTQAACSHRQSNFHIREQWLNKGIECLISQMPNLTMNEIYLQRQAYTKQAMNDHEFARRTREIGWRSLQVDEDRKEQASATKRALQEHAQVTELLMQAAQAEKQVLAAKTKHIIDALKAKQLVHDALVVITLHDSQNTLLFRNSGDLQREQSFRISRRNSIDNK